MSFFSATLADLMREQGVKQGELSERADVAQGLLSSYLNEQGRPKTDVLSRLCKAFGADGSRLAMAFLRDEVPTHLKSRIEIVDKGGKGTDEPTGFDIETLDPNLRQFLEDAARICERRPKVLVALKSLFDLIATEPDRS